MINAKPDSLGKWNNAKEENSPEDNFWQNLTEGELVDIDLFTACALGEYDYVHLIIQNAKSSTDIVNKSNSARWTPLMYACYVGNDKITELLVREGADVLFDENKRGCTPLMLAAASGNISLVKHLVENNARINRMDKHGQTALFHAAEHGQTSVVKYLLSMDADILIRQNGTGYTPFMVAGKQGLEGVFGAFLEHGIDLDLVCNKGYTVRDLAQQFGRHVIINMIDNYCLKFPSLRYDADLSDFGMEEVKQPCQKVNEWLNDNNPDHFFDDLLSNKLSQLESQGIAIDNRFKTYSVGDSFGKSVGDSTIADSDRTPVGTPVDSIFQQYMARDTVQRRSPYDIPTLETFLKDLDLEKYLKVFEDASIDFNIFVRLTEEDFKELGIVLGPRRKLKLATDRWKEDTEWLKYGKSTLPEVDNLKVQLADVYSKLQHVSMDLVREKKARSLLEAEQMEGRARRNHMYFIGEKVLRSCKELQSTNKTLRKHVETLNTLANENKNEDIRSRLKELHKQMSEDASNAENITDTIFRRVEKLICDDVTELSSSSDSPESSCTSFSKSESGSGVIE